MICNYFFLSFEKRKRQYNSGFGNALLFAVGFVFCFYLTACTAGRSSETGIISREEETRKNAVLIQSYVETQEKKEDDAIDSWLSGLSPEEKYAQLFLVNLAGNEIFQPVEYTGDIEGHRHQGDPLIPGGYLFFSYNLAVTPEKIMTFTDSIRSYCLSHDCIPPYLALDQEGGYVQRLQGIAGPLPSQERVADNMTIEQAYRLYSLQAVQMRSLGFTMDLAPVAEVKTAGNKDFLATRSFGDVQQAESYSITAVNAFQNNGIAAVLKHFPGNTNTDPHTGLPEISLTDKELDLTVIKPFTCIIAHAPDGILMSLARTASHDAKTPASLSRYWVSDILRSQMEFKGIVLSDDIFMGALSDNGFDSAKASVMAIEAGVDCIMVSEKRFAAQEKVLLRKIESDPIFAGKADTAVRKIIKWKLRRSVFGISISDEKIHIFVPNVLPDSERMKDFTSARTENIALYRKYFSSQATDIHDTGKK